MHKLGALFDKGDYWLTQWAARYGLHALRISIGVIFVWFGALKFFPGLSPAEGLVFETMPAWVPMSVFYPLLAVWEVVIGVGFILGGRFLRPTILLMLLHMPGTASPLVLNPDAVWTAFPFGLTLEGQYIIKNLTLVSAAVVVGAAVRGGGLTNKAEAMAIERQLEEERRQKAVAQN
jgi:uncharacterized membrane protein YkgB